MRAASSLPRISRRRPELGDRHDDPQADVGALDVALWLNAKTLTFFALLCHDHLPAEAGEALDTLDELRRKG